MPIEAKAKAKAKAKAPRSQRVSSKLPNQAGLQPGAASSKSAIFLVSCPSSLASQQTNPRASLRAPSHEL
jgi:hypothetical protein